MTLLSVATWSRWLRPPRQRRDRVGRRDFVVTAQCVATPAAEFPPFVFTSRVVVTTSSRTEFPTMCTFRTVLVVRLLSSGRACAGRRRRGGSRSPRS
ncbi:hypothetical protein Taro_054331 [Colocasia esculenta]|uniref:Uncharacterized protein n=1 Tax=Colocasia esculenta TaxID=4460 RepID=A0A843XNE9_COLES|nr:hypothetical protein [Colocasia esculenta]